MKRQARGISSRTSRWSASAAICIVAVLLGALTASDTEAQTKARGQTDLGFCQELYYYSGGTRVGVLLALDEVAVEVSGDAKAALSGVRSLTPNAEANLFARGTKALIRLAAPATDHVTLTQQAAVLSKAGYAARAVLYPEGAAGRTETYMQVLSGRLAVKLQDGQDLNALMKRYGLVLSETVDYSPSTYILEAPGGSLTRSLDTANALYEDEGVAFATPLILRQHSKKLIPTDPLFGDQHHLRNTAQFSGHVAGNDVNIVSAWDSFTGNGVTIGIVDDGLETGHEDLAANVRTDIDIDIYSGDSDPNPGTGDDHGTAVAGVAAAVAQNSKGGVGAGFDATLVGIRLVVAGTTDAQDAQAMNHQVAPASASDRIHINSNSWGPPDDGVTAQPLLPLTAAALENGVTNGRGGLGTIYVWAAGNGRQAADNVNFDGYASSRYTIAVGATGGNGTYSYYSEPGASMLVNTTSNDSTWGITTTDRTGGPGYSGTSYTNSFGGTSSATPLASGCIALMLEANPALTWRDVQHILVNTATKNDSGNSGWFTNGAGFHFNHAYGFGRIDGSAAVTAAQTWTNVPANATPLANSESVSVAIPDNNPTGITRTLSLSSGSPFALEHVEVTVNITHTYRGDLAITLTSPSGTESELATVRGDNTDNFSNYMFTTVAHWGEDPNGTWTLRVSDNEPADTGTLNSWSIQARGYEPVAQPVLSVTPSNRDVASASGTTTFDVSNTGGGTMNWTASVTSGASWLSIQSGSSGTDAGTITAAFTENSGSAQRVGSIQVSATGATGSPQTVTVTQVGDTTPVLEVTPANRNVAYPSGTTTFGVSNTGGGTMNWTASVVSGASWLSIQSGSSGVGSGTVTAAFTENTSASERVGSIQVSATGATGSPQTVTVTQAGNTTPVLEVTPANRDVASASGTTTFDVANTGAGTLNWTASVISGGSWLSIQSGSSGMGSGTITAAFTQNTGGGQRVGSIQIAATGATGSPQTVTVTQAGDTTPALSVTPSNRDVASASGTTTFDVSNTGAGTLNWTAAVTSGGGWLSIQSGSSGTDAGTITAAFTENTGGAQRVGAIEVSASGATGSPQTVTVTQEGSTTPALYVAPSNRDVAYASGTRTFSVSNTGGGTMNWTAAVTSGGSWLSIQSGASGTDDGTISVAFTENGTGSERVGSIQVTASGATGSPQTVTVTQAPDQTPSLQVTPANRDVPYTTGTTSFSIRNVGLGSLAWSASVTSGSSWLSISGPSGGVADSTLTLSFSANTSSSPRVGTITVSGTGAQNSPQSVTVTQAGNPAPRLSVTPASRSVSYGAGSTSYAVQNLGTDPMNWTAAVTSGGDWITIVSGASGTDDGTIVVSYTENPAGVARSGQVTITAPGAMGSPVTVQLDQSLNPTLALSVAPSVRDVGFASGTTAFSVTNAGGGVLDWTASVVAGSSWLTILSGETGTGSGSIVVQFGENTSGATRVGQLRVEVPGAANSPTTVSVQQTGDPTPQLSLSPVTQTVGYAAGSASYSVQNLGIDPMVWSAAVTSGSDWIAIASGASGTDDATITVSYTENPSAESRAGAITVTASGALGSPATVQLTQARNTTLVLSVTPSSRNVGAAGGTTSFSVANSGGGVLNWTAAVAAKASWLTILSGETGTGAGSIVAEYQDNPNAEARVGYIDVEVPGALNSPVRVSVTQDCAAPDPPTGVSASDGTFPDRVRITWNPVPGATGYNIYRADTNSIAAASLLGAWTSTSADDFSAAAGAPVQDSGGCQSSGASLPAYYYWVTSVSDCGEGVPSSSDQGQAGGGAKALALDDATYAKVLPAVPLGDGTLLQAGVDSPLFVRLRGTEPIAPDSVTGRVSGAGVDTDLVFWIPAEDGTPDDGWAAAWPVDSWPLGAILTMTVAARTESGQEVGPLTYQFVTMPRSDTEAVDQPSYDDFDASGLDLSVESNDAVALIRIAPTEEPPPLAQGVGPVYRLGPDEVFAMPQRVWVPVPEGYGVDELDVYFHQSVSADAGWYAADLVDAWIVPGSYVQLDIDGTTYLGLLTRHAGTLQLGTHDASGQPDAAGLGNVLLLAAAALVLATAGRRRAAKRMAG